MIFKGEMKNISLNSKPINFQVTVTLQKNIEMKDSTNYLLENKPGGKKKFELDSMEER